MIAKGNVHAHGGKLAAYLVTGKDGEKAELHALRGFAAADIKAAFRSVAFMAQATQCEKPFFHVQVRNPDGEKLTREQWERVADRMERANGLIGQPRAMAFHTDQKTGHEHLHLAWSRIDGETLKAKPLPFFKLRLKEACRELEDELGLTKVRNERARPDIRAAHRADQAQAKRLGTDDRAIRAVIRDVWEHADSGKAFAAALKDKGLILCAGDRRDFVVMDERGGTHALGKRLLGVSAAQTRTRLADLDRAAMPSVIEGRADMHTRAMVREAEPRPIEQEAKAAAVELTHPLLPTTQETARVIETVTRKGGGVAVKGLEQAANAVGGLVSGLGDFLFGGIGHSKAAPEQRTAPAGVAKSAPPVQTRQAYLDNMASPIEATHEGASGGMAARPHLIGVKPEIVDAMRRKIEAERRRERELKRDDDFERDRDR